MEKDVKDAGTGGTEGASVAAGCSSALEELKKPLRRLFFFERTRLLCLVGLSAASLALDLSGMLEAPVNVLCLLASRFNEFLRDSGPSFFGLAVSFVGEDGRERDPTQLFLRSADNDRTGEMDGADSSRFMLLLRLRLESGSADGSRLLLLKGRNLVDLRELLGLSCGFCSMGGGSSESALDPSEEPEDVASTLAPFFSSSSDMVPRSPSTAGSSRSFTRGK